MSPSLTSVSSTPEKKSHHETKDKGHVPRSIFSLVKALQHDFHLTFFLQEVCVSRTEIANVVRDLTSKKRVGEVAN